MDCLERSFPLSFSKVTPAIGNSMLFVFCVSGTEDSGAGEAAPESEPEDRAHDKRINPITMQVMPFTTSNKKIQKNSKNILTIQNGSSIMQIYRNEVHSKTQKGSVKMIGAYLKAYMKEKGIKQSFIAEKINLSPQILGAMLNGQRKIEVTEFYAICSAMEADPTKLAISAGIYKVQQATT